MDSLEDRVNYFMDKVEHIWDLPFEKMIRRSERLRKYKEAILKQYEVAK